MTRPDVCSLAVSEGVLFLCPDKLSEFKKTKHPTYCKRREFFFLIKIVNFYQKKEPPNSTLAL